AAVAVAVRGASVSQGVEGILSEPGRVLGVVADSAAAATLAVGIVPMVGLVVLVLTDLGAADRSRAAFAAIALSLAVTLLVYVGGKAAALGFIAVTRVEERNLIYLEAVAIVATVAVLGRVPLSRWVGVAVVVAGGALSLDVGGVAGTPILSEAPGLSWAYYSASGYRDVLLVCLAMAALLVGLVRGRRGGVALVAAALVAWLVWSGSQAFRGDRHQARVTADFWLRPARDWVDRAVAGRRVAVLVTEEDSDPNGLWSLAFWNRSVWSFATADAGALGLAGTPTQVGPEGAVGVRGSGFLLHGSSVLVGGVDVAVPPGARYRLTDLAGATTVEGSGEPVGLARVQARARGRTPDGWMGGTLTVTRYVEKPGGRVIVPLDGRTPVVTTPRTVVATVAQTGLRVRATVPPGGSVALAVPVPRGPFTLTVRVRPTQSPVSLGLGVDTRELGLRVGAIEIPGLSPF
ncbi:MAG: hypothetical protein AB1416_05135, partial [Actinomycetota bacterium]